jgi:zinc protease
MTRLATRCAAGLALAALALPAGAQNKAAPAAVSAEPVLKFLAGGIPVIYKHITANDVIAMQLYLEGGSAALTPATAGIEHLLGEAATHGTAKYSKDRFAALATSTGTNISATAGYDYTVLSAQAVRQNWDAAWDLFTQAALHPTFPADEVEQVRGQIVNELKQRADDPDSRLDLLADSVQYAGHSYAVDAEGTTTSIAKLTRDDLVRWHKRRLTKENLLLVVVGNVSREDVMRKVAAAFATLPAQGGAVAHATSLRSATPSVQTVKQELPTNYIMGVFAAPAPSHPDFPALRVAVRVLSDRLFEEVRTKRNLTYAVSAGLATRAANRGDLYVTAVNPDTTVKVIIAEVKRLQRDLVPAQLLGETINVFATQTWMGQQTNMGQASQLGLWEIQGGGWQNAARYVDRLRAVTPQQVQRAAQAYLRNVRFVVIGDPAKVSAALFKSL